MKATAPTTITALPSLSSDGSSRTRPGASGEAAVIRTLLWLERWPLLPPWAYGSVRSGKWAAPGDRLLVGQYVAPYGRCSTAAPPWPYRRPGLSYLGTLPSRTLFGEEKAPQSRGFESNSGGGIRTRDLRVMSPTSYLTAPPRVAWANNVSTARTAVKGRRGLRTSCPRGAACRADRRRGLRATSPARSTARSAGGSRRRGRCGRRWRSAAPARSGRRPRSGAR